MNNRILTCAVLAGALSAAVLTVSLVAAETKPKRAATQIFMRQKLAWSQGVIEGLTLEKFDLVTKNAIRMRDVTQSNLWFSMRQPEYMTHTTNYQKSVDALFMAATDKNLDASTEAYVKVTRQCVECHRFVRTEQRKNAGKAPAVEPATQTTP